MIKKISISILISFLFFLEVLLNKISHIQFPENILSQQMNIISEN